MTLAEHLYVLDVCGFLTIGLAPELPALPPRRFEIVKTPIGVWSAMIDGTRKEYLELRDVQDLACQLIHPWLVEYPHQPRWWC
jgi:hypothetical protein